jgi:hypothetical protein
LSDLAAKPAVMMQIPPEQYDLPETDRVFRDRDLANSDLMVGPVYYNRIVEGTFQHALPCPANDPKVYECSGCQDADGSSKCQTCHLRVCSPQSPVLMQITNDGVIVSGVVRDRLATVVKYIPPSLMRFIFPIGNVTRVDGDRPLEQ